MCRRAWLDPFRRADEMKERKNIRPHSPLSRQFPISVVILDNLRSAQPGERRRNRSMERSCFRITRDEGWIGESMNKKAKFVLTCSSTRAVLTVPDVAEDGIGQLLTKCHVKIPQRDLSTFEPLPSSTIPSTGTGRAGRVRQRLAYAPLPR